MGSRKTNKPQKQKGEHFLLVFLSRRIGEIFEELPCRVGVFRPRDINIAELLRFFWAFLKGSIFFSIAQKKILNDIFALRSR